MGKRVGGIALADYFQRPPSPECTSPEETQLVLRSTNKNGIEIKDVHRLGMEKENEFFLNSDTCSPKHTRGLAPGKCEATRHEPSPLGRFNPIQANCVGAYTVPRNGRPLLPAPPVPSRMSYEGKDLGVRNGCVPHACNRGLTQSVLSKHSSNEGVEGRAFDLQSQLCH